jgi:hypothetical protein
VNLTVTATTTGEIEVAAESGEIAITVTSPAQFAGTYVMDVDGVPLSSISLATGPRCLVAPRIALLSDADGSGSIGIGDILGIEQSGTASHPGLWLYDVAGGEPVIGRQWQTSASGSFTDIIGATEVTRQVSAGETGAAVRLVETATTSLGTTAASSNTLDVASAAVDVAIAAAHNMSGFGVATRTIAGVALGAPAADREILVFYAGRMASVPAPGEWRCTVAGIATTAEALREVPSAQSLVIGWRLSVPTGTAGDIVLQRVSGNNSLFGGAILVLRATGTPLLGAPQMSFDNIIGDETPTPYMLSVSLPVTAGGVVAVLAGMTRNSGVSFTGATELVDGGTPNGGGAAAFVSGLPSSASYTMTGNFAGATPGDDALLLAVELS